MEGYEAYAEDTASSSDMAALATFADDLQDAEGAVIDLEAQLKVARSRMMDLSERVIPELMDSLDLELFKTVSGLQISVRRTIRASIPVANKVLAMAWLDDHGHSGLIKRSVHISFDRDQGDAASELQEELGGKFENVKQERKVEPSTLRAFIGEQLKAGEAIPLELFGAWEQRTAKITSTA